MSNWTRKRRIFVEEYFKCKMNGTEAAKRAGFKHPAVAASKLKKVKIIKDEIEKRLANFKMEADEALRIIAEQSRYDLGPYLILDDDDPDSIKVDVRALKEAGLTHLIKGIVPTKEGVRVEFVDKQYAVNLVLKAQGAYSKQTVELTGKDGGPIEVASSLSLEERMARVLAIVEQARKRDE